LSLIVFYDNVLIYAKPGLSAHFNSVMTVAEARVWHPGVLSLLRAAWP